MKKKIVFLIRDLGYGGAQRQLVTLIKDFDKEKFDVTVLHFYSDSPLDKELKERNIPVISLEKQGRWDLIGFFWRLIRYLQQIKPDLLHTYMAGSNIVAILVRPFFPATRIIWGIRMSHKPADLTDWVVNMLGKLHNLLSHAADLIIVNSHAGKEDYVKSGFPVEKMVVVSNGIDTERFQPDREAGVKVRLEWGILENQILIGLVGRMYPQKDHPNFLKAAALLSQEYQDVYFVCVGTGPDQNYIQEIYQIAEELGISKRVIWPGVLGDMRAVQNALDIAVSASAFGEGFGNTIGEAMACGVLCVVTDVGDSAWIVGDTGVVVPPHNSEALAAGIKKLIELNYDEKTALQEKARRKIVECFSVDNLVATTISHCLQTLNN
ncbi:glycosyltransferase [Anabaena sp. UHCC 0451]|uniref:glycosyltransferase n=1 Tax=Anabaena sp. UHCC 0451 TaxID=2055235 RepID=UPI002B1F46AB|nr:glycosyltransferase [Anabaena sp. UHCC 0451]MEA5579047.1 glycosyltransferase [Anabaena sp. UHCC 0451]